ncbi:hypothetical protein TNCV_3748481 [Trichonephila clavipes]|nr:hypothetical protein TNCV_3748481 [Trichonephila clavipes]
MEPVQRSQDISSWRISEILSLTFCNSFLRCLFRDIYDSRFSPSDGLIGSSLDRASKEVLFRKNLDRDANSILVCDTSDKPGVLHLFKRSRNLSKQHPLPKRRLQIFKVKT